MSVARLRPRAPFSFSSRSRTCRVTVFNSPAIKLGGFCVNSMSSVHLDHLAHLVIAADAAQFRIRQPLPGRALVSQVIEKSFRTRDQRPILSMRPQTHVDAVEITFPRDAPNGPDHLF